MARPIQGLNLDIREVTSRPDEPADISRVGYCRFVYDVNNGKPDNISGGQSFDADVDHLFQNVYLPQQFDPAFAFYDSYLQKCLQAGITPIAVFNHETFGEGWLLDFAGAMQNSLDPRTRDRWARLSGKLAEIIKRVAESYGNKIVYQIWNEQDQPSGSAVGVPAACYAEMLVACADAIRDVAPNATIITGGLTSGNAPQYWQEVRSTRPEVDSIAGLAIHPYDCGLNTFVAEGPAGIKKRLTDKIWAWRQQSQLAAKSIWITEFGCGGDAQLSDATAADYARTVFGHLNGKVTAAIWFGWGNMNPAAGCYPVARSAADGAVLWNAFTPSIAPQPSGNDGGALPHTGGGAGTAAPAAGVIAAPLAPQAFNNQYELDIHPSNWRGAWSWARGGGGSRRWLRLLAAPDAPYSDAAMRDAAMSPKAVEDAIAYLDPAKTKRYAPIRGQNGALINSFCNIFVNDATRVLHCEVPNNPASTTVSSMQRWLEQHGANAGWTKTTDGALAQSHVNAGKVAVMIWSTGSFEDHVALVRPGQFAMSGGASWPRIAQVGALVSADLSSYTSFSALWAQNRAALMFYLHD